MQLKAVVLPAPLGPMRPTISHSPTDSDRDERACSPPKRMETSRSSRTATGTLPVAGGPVVGPGEVAAPQPGHERGDAGVDATRVDRQGDQQQEGADQVGTELLGVGGELARQHMGEGDERVEDRKSTR